MLGRLFKRKEKLPEEMLDKLFIEKQKMENSKLKSKLELETEKRKLIEENNSLRYEIKRVKEGKAMNKIKDVSKEKGKNAFWRTIFFLDDIRASIWKNIRIFFKKVFNEI